MELSRCRVSHQSLWIFKLWAGPGVYPECFKVLQWQRSSSWMENSWWRNKNWSKTNFTFHGKPAVSTGFRSSGAYEPIIQIYKIYFHLVSKIQLIIYILSNNRSWFSWTSIIGQTLPVQFTTTSSWKGKCQIWKTAIRFIQAYIKQYRWVCRQKPPRLLTS